MTKPVTDLLFVESLGLSEAQVADAIGKSRQALNVGLPKPKDGHYFRDKELADLYLFCKRSNLVEDEEKVAAHVHATRPDSAKDILSYDGDYLVDAILNEAEFIFAAMPGYDYFSEYLLPHHEMLVRAARRTPGKFVPITSTPAEADAFWRAVAGTDTTFDLESQPRIISPKSDALPYVVFLDPLDRIRRRSYVLGRNGFQEQIKIRGTKMFDFILDESDCKGALSIEPLSRELAQRTG